MQIWNSMTVAWQKVKKNFNWRKAIILKWLSRLISAWTWWNLGAVKVFGFYCSDFTLPPHTLKKQLRPLGSCGFCLFPWAIEPNRSSQSNRRVVHELTTIALKMQKKTSDFELQKWKKIWKVPQWGGCHPLHILNSPRRSYMHLLFPKNTGYWRDGFENSLICSESSLSFSEFLLFKRLTLR